MSNRLNERQLLFCKLYAIEGNGTKAAIEAGFSGSTQGVTASKLLKLAKIQAKISELREKSDAKIELKHEVSRDRVINELAKIAFSDAKVFLIGENNMRDIRDMDNQQTAAIASIKFDETPGLLGTRVKKTFTLWDKNKALEMLAKHFGLFEVDNNQKRTAIQINYMP